MTDITQNHPLENLLPHLEEDIFALQLLRKIFRSPEETTFKETVFLAEITNLTTADIVMMLKVWIEKTDPNGDTCKTLFRIGELPQIGD